MIQPNNKVYTQTCIMINDPVHVRKQALWEISPVRDMLVADT